MTEARKTMAQEKTVEKDSSIDQLKYFLKEMFQFNANDLDFGIYRNYFKTIFYRKIQGTFYRNVCFNGLAYYFLFQRINGKSTF